MTSQALAVISAALKGYHLDGADLIHAIRMWRAACHGLAPLEMAGGFGLPESIDATFLRAPHRRPGPRIPRQLSSLIQALARPHTLQ